MQDGAYVENSFSYAGNGDSAVVNGSFGCTLLRSALGSNRLHLAFKRAAQAGCCPTECECFNHRRSFDTRQTQALEPVELLAQTWLEAQKQAS